MNRTFLTILRECLQSNALFQKGLLAYSLLLIVLGAQLPLNFYLYTTLAMTPVLIFWFMTYSRWNRSAEFLSTLPDFNRYARNAKICGGILISLPFYVINGLSMLRDLTGYRGQYESVGSFTIKGIVFITIYLIAFRIIAGKTVKTPSNLFFRKIRMIFALGVMLFSAILGYAIYNNLGFYESIPLITNPQRLLPNSYTDKTSYECANPDQLLINVYVTQYDDPQKVSYISHKVLDWQPGRAFEFFLGELPNAPKRFEQIIVQGKRDQIKVHDGNTIQNNLRGKYAITIPSPIPTKNVRSIPQSDRIMGLCASRILGSVASSVCSTIQLTVKRRLNLSSFPLTAKPTNWSKPPSKKELTIMVSMISIRITPKS